MQQAHARVYLATFAVWIVCWGSLVFVTALGRQERSVPLAGTVVLLFLRGR